MERECHDMYGIVFEGNADLRPILLYEGFVGHPLRKDYPKDREQPLVPYRDASPWNEPANERPANPRIANPIRSAFTRGERDDTVIVSIGPSHPATHGTIQIYAELDGERILARRRPLRLPAPRVREGVRVAHLAQPHPVHRPPQLLLAADQRLRLLRDRRAPDGRRDPAARKYLRTLLSEYARLSPTT